jgi:serine/threonine-protein kinase RsbW
MEHRFRRTVEALEEVFDFVSEAAARYRLTGDVVFRLELAIEEIFVNMVKHSIGSKDVLVSIARDGGKLVISLTDFDVEAYDITKVEKYDTAQPLDSRPVGHLGIHLVRKVADEIVYDYENRQSRVTLIKNLEKTDVQD